MIKPLMKFVFVPVLIFFLALAGYIYSYINSPSIFPQQKDVIVEPGSIRNTAEILAKEGVIKHPDLFAIYAVITGKNKTIKAGEYEFPANISPRQVLEKLAKGAVKIYSVTLPEGFTTYQMLKIINADLVLKGEAIAELPEGTLLPETYFFSRGYTRQQLISRMQKDQGKILEELWNARDPSVPLKNREEAITLASIVERETSLSDEMPRVAGVFYNRLRAGMPLQSDPTALYVVSKKTGVLDRELTKKDLEVQSPYNTYVSNGLPPGPIANPGAEAIHATLNPISTDELYFVADGKGGHNFSKTLEQHNKYVAEYRVILRQQKP